MLRAKPLSPRTEKSYLDLHYRVPSIRAKEPNLRVERLHGTEKESIKVCGDSTTATAQPASRAA